MDRGLVKRVRYSLMRPLAFLLTFLCVFGSSIGVRADETQSDNESDGIVIESVQAVVPQLTAYIRGDHQIGVSDISAQLDGEALTVKSVDFFENMGQGVTYYILLDVSASFSTSYFNALQNSLVTFRSGLSDKDRMVLITFGSSVETVLDGDETDEEAQEKIMSLVNGDNDTYFYEALMQAADETDRNNDNSREVIMMISDGGDDHNTGKANAQEAVAALNKRNIPVYGYAAGANQNNMQSFAELTEACGGTVTEFTSQETDKIFTNFKRMLGEMQVVTLMTDNNIASNKTETLQLTLLSDGSTASKSVLITEHIPDETAPEIIAVRKSGDKELIVSFSEQVSGADKATAYVVTCDGITLDVMNAEYDASDCSALISFNSDLSSGEYVIEVRGIADISAEKNPVVESFNKVIKSESDEADTETESSTQAEDETSGQAEEDNAADSKGSSSYTVFIIVGAAVLILIAAGVVSAVLVKKKNADQERIKRQQEEERLRKSSQTSGRDERIQQPKQNKTVQLQLDAGRRIVFEILNVEAGQNSIVEAELNKSMIVGRADICDVCIKDNRISRQHFALEEKNGLIYVRDLQTTNGTSVNGVKLSGAKQLNNNDIISAGSVKLRVRW